MAASKAKKTVKPKKKPATVTEQLNSLIGQIEGFQSQNEGAFSCVENEKTIQHLRAALKSNDRRIVRREQALIEGEEPEPLYRPVEVIMEEVKAEGYVRLADRRKAQAAAE